MNGDESAQEDELLALESIFESEDVLVTSTLKDGDVECRSGCLNVTPQLKNDRIRVLFEYATSKDCSEEATGAVKSSVHEVRFLPPVALRFVLPQHYPSRDPPRITLLCKWLDRRQLTSLVLKLDELWQEQVGQEVLYTWYTFIQEQSLDILAISEELTISQDEFMKTQKDSENDHRVAQTATYFSDVVSGILDYNELQLNKLYESTPHTCNICFSEKYGKDCLEFKGCQHVYCKQCITSYFDVQIKEGNVRSLTCPEPKCTSQAYPAQVKELVTSDDFARYETLLFQTTLDTMKDVIYCPRKHCQSPVIVDPDDTIGICSVCSFSFCPYCKLAYHGVEPCKLKAAAMRELCEEYKNADSLSKKQMETRYGAKNLIATLQNIESEEWIKSNSKNCPGCGAAIEKNDGCNKMTCYKCKAYFCWLCMTRLSTANPYSHYNTFGSKCFNKLFEGVEDDGYEQLDWFV